VDQFTGGVSHSYGSRLQEARSRSLSIPTAARELLRERLCHKVAATSDDSALEKRRMNTNVRQVTDSDLGQIEEQHGTVEPPRFHRTFTGYEDMPPLRSVSCQAVGNHEDISSLVHAMSSCTESQETATGMRSAATRICKRKPGTSEGPWKVVASEVWTSVDKTLVEELFDHVLRSFDDINVGEPEADETGNDGSRGPPSANRRPRPSGTYDVTDGQDLLQSAAYKWKSHILQRMRTQQVTHHVLSRKRRYADRQLLAHNPACELLEG